MAAGSIHNPLRKGMRARELGLKREGGGGKRRSLALDKK